MTQPSEILLVDDELTLLAVLREALESEGHVVHLAANALGAFEVLQRHPNVGLVVTDVAMPGAGDGRQLAEYVRRAQPGIPIILISGKALPAAGDVADGVHVLAKPFDIFDFVAKVKALLPEAGAAPGEHQRRRSS
jgi:two-component system, response regulator PdtaR